MNARIIRSLLIMGLSFTLLSTTCCEEHLLTKDSISAIRVEAFDNSGSVPVGPCDEAPARALLLQAMPQWDKMADIYQLTDSLTALRVMAVDDTGEMMRVDGFRCLVPFRGEDNDVDFNLIDFEFDDSGVRFKEPIGLIGYGSSFYLAYVPEGEPLTGTFRFRVILDCKSGRNIAALSQIVRLTNPVE